MFSLKLKELRELRGYKSQQAFADAFGVRQSTVGNWEAGKRSPDIKTVAKIADFLDVSVDELLRGNLTTMNRGVVTSGLYSYLLNRLGSDEEIASFLKGKGIELGSITKSVGAPIRIPTETLRIIADEFGDDPNFIFCLSDGVDPKIVRNAKLPADFQSIIDVAEELDATGLQKLLEYGEDLRRSGRYNAKKGAQQEQQAM